MTKGKTKAAKAAHESSAPVDTKPFSRVFAVVVGLENYQKPPKGAPLPSVKFAHADAEAMKDTLNKVFADLPQDDVSVDLLKDDQATLAGLKSYLQYTIKSLAPDDLFIFYYAGHGFHDATGNRLSTYDTVVTNKTDTTLSLSDDLLKPLKESACTQALVFADACAEKMKDFIDSRDVISDLDRDEVKTFLDSAWYLGVFLSCSPGERSYPSEGLGHGIWTHFLLEALSGKADAALRDRWLTGESLQNYLRQQVPQYITKSTNIKDHQTPQAVLEASSSFRIHYVPKPLAAPKYASLAGVKLANNSEFLEGTETGAIRGLDGFNTGSHKVPKTLSVSANSWCQRLLANRISEEIQELYIEAKTALGLRRKALQKESGDGGADLDAPGFRYSIESGQNPDDPSEYYITRRLTLRQGWDASRDAIHQLFGNQFQLLVVDFDKMDVSFDDLVEQLEDIALSQGDEVEDDDDVKKRVSYRQANTKFTFDLKKRRLEISFGMKGSLNLVDAAQAFQLGISAASPMLPGPANLPAVQ